MCLAPINPSDLIPITGAYAHRIQPPQVAGYEGLGRVIAAPAGHAGLLGRRVLPLRGPGTWARHLDCDPALAVPVPEGVADEDAARAYINPLAALRMIDLWPVAGRQVLLLGAGSGCSEHLARAALAAGAAVVAGVHRSPGRARRLEALGVRAVPLSDTGTILDLARSGGVTFDALGGPVAGAVLDTMPPGAAFVGYGLLTGQPVRPSRPPRAGFHRFHLRDSLAGLAPADWQAMMRRV
ncbi:alcohol dehydrogenase [Frigidibacter sp. MR17.14]|uniref:alcohol dehydrogenase n=1 Tax=Frigidibacter sp. MR17.14 TaxID=3126509 RepID=UPI003012F0C4